MHSNFFRYSWVSRARQHERQFLCLTSAAVRDVHLSRAPKPRRRSILEASTAVAELCTRNWAAAQHFADTSNPLLNAHVLPDPRVAKRGWFPGAMHSINCSSCSQATLVQRRRVQHRPITSVHTVALKARRQSHQEEQQKPLYCLVQKRRANTVRSSRLQHIAASSNGSHSKEPMRVMISGAPATGKGTQCSRIVEKFGLVHISAGDLLRAEVAAGTPAGKEAASYMDSGNLVPNSVVVEMVVNRLEQPDVQEHGWLLDGYPRSGDQAEAIVQKGIKPDLFVLISVPDEDLVDRVAGRRLDPETGDIYHMKHKPPPEEVQHRLIQRSDDTAEKVKTRLHNHHSNVDAVLGYYQDQLVEVDGTQSMDDVFSAIDEHLSKLSESRSHALAA